MPSLKSSKNLPFWKPSFWYLYSSLLNDMGGMPNVWGNEDVPENAPSRQLLEPLKLQKEVLACSIVGLRQRETELRMWAQPNCHVYNERMIEESKKDHPGPSVQSPFSGRVSFARFSSPVCLLFLGPERAFQWIYLPKFLGELLVWKSLQKPLILCREGPNCSENPWNIFRRFFAIGWTSSGPNVFHPHTILLMTMDIYNVNHELQGRAGQSTSGAMPAELQAWCEREIYIFIFSESPVRRGLFPVVRDFLCIIPTEQVLY